MSDETNETKPGAPEVSLVGEKINDLQIKLNVLEKAEHEHHDARMMYKGFTREHLTVLAEEIETQEKRNGNADLTLEQLAEIVLKKGEELNVQPQLITTKNHKGEVTVHTPNIGDRTKKLQLEAIEAAKEKIPDALGMKWLESAPFGKSIRSFFSESIELAFEKKVLSSAEFSKKHPLSWKSPFGAIGQFFKISFGNIFTGMFSDVGKLFDGIANVSAPGISQPIVSGVVGAATVAGTTAVAGKGTWDSLTQKASDGAKSVANEAVEKAEEVTPSAKKALGITEEEEKPAQKEAIAAKTETLEEYFGNKPKYLIGSKMLLGLSGKSYTKNVERDSILQALEHKPYHELVSIISSTSKRKEVLDDNPSEDQSNMLDDIINGLLSSNSRKLLSFQMRYPYLKNTIFNNEGQINETLIPYFTREGETSVKAKERLIQLTRRRGKIEWEDYTVQELSVLYFQSIPVLRLPRERSLTEVSAQGLSFVTNGMSLDQIESSNDLTFPLPLAKSIFTSYPLPNFGGRDLMSKGKDRAFKTVVLEGLTPSDKAKHEVQLTKLIDFKNSIKKTNFLKHAKLKFRNQPHVQAIFEGNLNYKWVIALYGVLGGNANLDEINPVNLPMLVWTIGQIIGGGEAINRLHGSMYVGGYATDVLIGNGDEILSKEEQEVFKVYEEKLIDVSVIAHLRKFYSALGYTLSPTGLEPEEFALLTGGIGVGGYLFANYNIKKGLAKGKIPLLKGLLLKRLSFAAIVVGAAIGSISYFGKDKLNYTFESSLSEAIEEGNTDRIKSLIQTHQMSLKTYQTHGGEEFHIYSYPGEPVMVFYNQKLYFPTLVEGTEEKDWIDKGKDLGQALIGFFASQGENTVRKVQKKKINTEITSLVGDKIQLGEGYDSEHMTINDIQEALRSGNNKESYEAHTEAAKWIEEVVLDSKYDVYFSNNAPTKYYPIKRLGDGKILALKEAGEIKTPE